MLVDLELKVVLRNYYGANNDLYSHPSCCWHPSGEYVYETSQDCSVCCWEVSTQKECCKLRGHTKQVRCLDFSVFHNALISVGYDATMKFWMEKEGKMVEEGKEKENVTE
jgi:WD40 repeat protein